MFEKIVKATLIFNCKQEKGKKWFKVELAADAEELEEVVYEVGSYCEAIDQGRWFVSKLAYVGNCLFLVICLKWYIFLVSISFYWRPLLRL